MEQLLGTVASFMSRRGIAAHVVGGAVRDRLLGSQGPRPGASEAGYRDIDIAVSASVVELADELAEATGGVAVVMDAERGHVRLVVEDSSADGHQWLDLTWDGGDFDSDLARRDFTINAMAVPLDRWAEPVKDALIDPQRGADDLRDRVVRETRPGNLVSDPVRLLRAVRFASQLEFELDGGTAAVIADNARLLGTVSGERVRDEFFELMAGRSPADAVRELDRLGLLDQLLPELTAGRGVDQPREHFYDVMEHQLQALELAGRLVNRESRSSDPVLSRAPWRPEFDDYLGEVIGDGQTRATLLKTVALLHDIGKPECKSLDPPTADRPNGRIRFLGHDRRGAEMARGLLHRLRCSRRTVAHVSLMIEEHLRPSQMSTDWARPTDRAIFRYFRDVSPVAVDTVLLNLCDYLAARGPLLEGPEFERYFEMLGDILSRGLEPEPKRFSADLLLDGRQVQERFGLQPGPEIGRLLGALRHDESSGAVRTRAEAYEMLARLLRAGSIASWETLIETISKRTGSARNLIRLERCRDRGADVQGGHAYLGSG
ncbi:MAG: HD domain-containing protein [Chloroflexi bacterium]|nr:HD domain-containing protein [Chloroflexota bacterium]